MIRNAVIHIMNEQPLLADLYGPPQAVDISLICTNLRTLNGKRPIFIDRSDSMFVLPYVQIRFVELPPDATGLLKLEPGDAAAGQPTNGHGPSTAIEPDLDLDEDFLRRVREI